MPYRSYDDHMRVSFVRYCQNTFEGSHFKGIVIDYNNIFIWHKSEDINKNRLFQKFQLILILCVQVMYNYVHWHCSIDYCVKIKSRIQDFMLKMALISYGIAMVSAKALFGKCASWRKAANRCKKFKFRNFWEGPLYEIWEYAKWSKRDLCFFTMFRTFSPVKSNSELWIEFRVP